MKKYYVLHERGRYYEVNAYSLDDVNRYSRLKFGKVKEVAETRPRDRKFGGLAELPRGFAGGPLA